LAAYNTEATEPMVPSGYVEIIASYFYCRQHDSVNR